MGIATAGVVIWFIQQINVRLFPLPEEIDIADKEALIAHMKTLPTTALIIVLISYLLGTAAGCYTAIKIAQSHYFGIVLIVAFFLLAMSMINLLNIPHPLWFAIINLILFLPTALLIHRFTVKSIKS